MRYIRLCQIVLSFLILSLGTQSFAQSYVVTFPFGNNVPIIKIISNPIDIPYSSLPSPFDIVIPSYQHPDQNFAYEYTYTDRLYASLGLSINASGSATMRFKFSNGLRANGAVGAIAGLINSEGEIIHAFASAVILQGESFCSGSCERRTEATFSASPDFWSDVVAIRLGFVDNRAWELSSAVSATYERLLPLAPTLGRTTMSGD